MVIKLKKAISLVMVFTMLFVLFSTSVFAADEKQTTLRVYNWGEYISNGDDGSMDVIAEFEKRNPTIKVEYSTFASNEEMYAKLESGSASYDIVIPSDYMIARMIKEDMIAPLNFANIPNFKYIDQNFVNPDFDPENKYSVPYTWGTVGIIYNTKKVTKPVDSWDILWDKDYKGQILMFDNSRDAFAIAEKKLGFSQNTTDRAELDQAAVILKEQKDVLQAYVMDQIFNKLASGEALIGPYYAGDAITMINDNPDLAFVIPKEGTNRFIDSAVVLKNSKHPKEAEAFINFLCEPEIMAENIGYIGYSSPETAARELLDDEMKNSPISYPEQSKLQNSEAFIHLPDETNEYMQDLWIEIKATDEGGGVGSIVLIGVLLLLAVAVVVFVVVKKKKKLEY